MNSYLPNISTRRASFRAHDIVLPTSIFQSINFLSRSMCLTPEMTDENYAVDELHQSDQVMQYRYMKMSNYGVRRTNT